jgi:hypothetical protein
MKNIFEEFQKDLNNESNERKQADKSKEEEVLEEYNGRQLLELLQNIDDQDSKEALIKLDTSNKILLIANTGTPFDEGGLKSLMMANLSPKKNKKFIGNKGLGFRSLLNWVGAIYVNSLNLSFEFSEKNRDRVERKENTERSICSTAEWIDEYNPREWINKIEIDNKYITYIAIHYENDDVNCH